MQYFKRYRFLFLTFGLLCLYFLTRIFHLNVLPIFTDEAIYIRWSQIGGNDANWRFISLTDGKQPLFTWLMMGSLRLFRDPLIAGRMVSVISGIGTFLGIGILSYELFRAKRITFFSLLFYVLSPFSLMYDRLALYDSLSAMVAIWSLYLAILLVKQIRLDIALVFGLTLGAGMLNKTSAFIAVYLLPFTLILFHWKRNIWKKDLLRWGMYAFIAFILSQLVYGILRLSPFYHMIAQKDFVFVHPFKNWYFLYPFFLGNIRGLLNWLTGYLTWPIFLLAIVSPFVVWFKEKKQKEHMLVILLLLIYCFVPMVGLAYFGKVLYPRFILFMAMPLLILAAFVFDWIIKKTSRYYYSILVSVLIMFPAVRSCYFITTNPLYAPIPLADRGQLLDDWPSGYGVKESVQFLTEKLENGPIAVYTEGTFGLFPYGLEIYLVNNPMIKIKGIWPLPENIPPEMVHSAIEKPTYFILNQTQKIPTSWPLELIAEYQKGTNKYLKMRLFQVIPPVISPIQTLKQ